MALTLEEQLIGGDPDAWKEFFPDYEPSDEVRALKAKAVSAGIDPITRALAVDKDIQDRSAAYQLTPLSDRDIQVAQSVGINVPSTREVPSVTSGGSGTLASLSDPNEARISSSEVVGGDQNARQEEANTQNPEVRTDDTEPTPTPRGSRTDPQVTDAGEGMRLFGSGSGPQGMGPGGPAGQGGSGTFAPGNPGNPIPTETTSDDEGEESLEDFENKDAESDILIEDIKIPRDFVKPLKPKPNILSEFSSYSYSLSLYLVQPGDYERMLLAGEKKLYNSTLLIQTGGISNGNEDSGNSRRNPYFDVDFYINNLEIESLVTGKSAQGAHNATRLRFNVTEPYGISFLDRLRDAVSNFRGSEENLFSQIYLLVIRFYGYDDSGELVQPENKAEDTSDSNAVIEKFIPFIWENIKFTVANQSAVYECKAVAVNQYVGLGQLTSTVPYNIEISGQTLSEIVNGKAVFADGDPDGEEPEEDSDADSQDGSQTKKTIKQGLVKALNDFEKSRAEKTGAIPNEYAIKLDESVGLSNAKMAQLEEAYLANLPIGGRTNQTLAQKTSIDNTRRKYSLIAGQPIVQVLDLLVRASTYITDQQLVKITEDPTADRKPGPRVEKAKKYAKLRDSQQGPVAWYKITTHIEPKEYDERRHEYSYKITYVVSGYQVNDLISEFFPRPEFRGVHKEYDYWFTGENTEVLNFEQEYNSLYYIRMAPSDVLTAAGIDPRQNRNSTFKATTQNTSDQSEVMGTGDSAQPSADAASSLYSPADQAMAEIKILGDPAWIQQSELLYNNVNGINYSPFLPDESINYDSQEPLFRITFNLPTDYDLETTGTMPVREYNKNDISGVASNEYVYRANRIINAFSGGEFTQQISATLMFDSTKENISSPSRVEESGGELFPLLGDEIILPGTSPDIDSSKNADVFSPDSGLFGVSGIDIIPDDLGLDDD